MSIEAATTPMCRERIGESDAHWMDMHDDQVEKTRTKPDAKRIFVGDSITQSWLTAGINSWDEHFASNSINLGIGGDQTGHVLWRLAHNDTLPNLKPKAVILLIGTNNLAPENSDEATFEGIKAVVSTLTEIFPSTPILVLSILPRGFNPDEPLRIAAAKTNERVAALEDQPNVLVRDIGKIFLEEDESIAPEIMHDSLHLSEIGYARFADALLTILKDLSS